jgi:hypothetical protein
VVIMTESISERRILQGFKVVCPFHAILFEFKTNESNESQPNGFSYFRPAEE